MQLQRWLHSLSPNVKKSAWTADEDQLLLSLYADHPGKWSVIARGIPGRTDDACSKRYREALDPTLKKDEWTEEEDMKLVEAYGRLGGKWGSIGQELGRSGLGCRNRCVPRHTRCSSLYTDDTRTQGGDFWNARKPRESATLMRTIEYTRATLTLILRLHPLLATRTHRLLKQKDIPTMPGTTFKVQNINLTGACLGRTSR